MNEISFREPTLARRIEMLPESEIDQLPFGVIRLDWDGNVTFFSQTERKQSGFKRRPGVGQNFFLDIAPCMNSPQFRGRIDAAQKNGIVDIEIGWIGDFADPERELIIRVQSASEGGFWVFISRDVE